MRLRRPIPGRPCPLRFPLLLPFLILFLAHAVACPAITRSAPAASPVPAQPLVRVEAASPALAAHAREVVLAAAPRLARWTGAMPPEIRVEIPPGREEYRRRVADLGGPEWAGGLALPHLGLIVVRSPSQLTNPGDFPVLLEHELIHLFTYTALRGRHAPLWLEEGLAMHLSQEDGWGRTEAMARGVLLGKLFRLDDLAGGYPEKTGEVDLAYAQSFYFLGWFLDKFGEEALAGVFASLAAEIPLTTAFKRATGHGQVALEDMFREDMESRFSWLALLGAGATFWAVLALAAGVILAAKRAAQKSRLRGRVPEEREGLRDGRVWPPNPAPRDVLGEAGLKPPYKAAENPGGAAVGGGEQNSRED